ncbi:MAG: phosphoribosylanthranilate isomerase [Lentisphaeria bacterium]|nr:phosphoribosylanthranilate isomerase [Lentisphaeria bacterium]
MLLKICGITREEDARCAALCGADFIGAIHVEFSKRFVTIEQAKKIFAVTKPAKTVLVVRDMELDKLQAIINEIQPYSVQLHGHETPDYASSITGTKVWKAFNINTLNNLQDAVDFPADIIVADSGGGTGQPCDWSRAAELARQRPVFLAGGITPENVQEAIAAVHPVGIDVAGGVESVPGIKDHEKIKKLCKIIK